MAIAITPFTGLCGFRPLSEIDHFLSTVPALRDLLGSAAIDSFKSLLVSEDEGDRKRGLRDLYAKLMMSDSTAIASGAESLVNDAKSLPDTFAGGTLLSNGGSFSDLIIELNNQFPSDVGLFSTFFLNFVSLSPGQAMFLQANEPHAYLSGGLFQSISLFLYQDFRDLTRVHRHNRVHGGV